MSGYISGVMESIVSRTSAATNNEPVAIITSPGDAMSRASQSALSTSEVTAATEMLSHRRASATVSAATAFGWRVRVTMTFGASRENSRAVAVKSCPPEPAYTSTMRPASGKSDSSVETSAAAEALLCAPSTMTWTSSSGVVSTSARAGHRTAEIPSATESGLIVNFRRDANVSRAVMAVMALSTW